MCNMWHMSATTNTLGERLAVRRRVLGFTQEQLAERVCRHPMTIRRWETGETQLDPFRYRGLVNVLDVMDRDRRHMLADLDPEDAA